MTYGRKRWPNKSRKRFHRAFVAWATSADNPLRDNLEFVSRQGDYLEAKLTGLTGEIVLSVWASTQCITVWVMHQGRAWDWFGDFNAPAECVSGGYVCWDCKHWPSEEVARTILPVYASREELWRKHAFSNLTAWALEKLSLRLTIEFYEFGDGSTWSRWGDPLKINGSFP